MTGSVFGRCHRAGMLAQEERGPQRNAGSDFDLEILDETGAVIAQSNLADGTDWVQLEVPAGTELQALVRLRSSFHEETRPYRLFVVGSTGELAGSGVEGPHVRAWETVEARRGR